MAKTRKLTPRGTLVPDKGPFTTQLVLYAADTPNNWKPAMLLEEMGLDYNVVLIDIMHDKQKEPDYLQINPNGRTPTLVDHSVDPPFAVFESAAIMLYLASKHRSPLLPTEPLRRSEVEQWLIWQAASLSPMHGQCMYFKRIASPIVEDLERLRFSIGRFHNESHRLLTILDKRLTDRDYICGPDRGDLTLVDLACYGYACADWWCGMDEEVHNMPNLQRWLSTMAQRPAVQHGMSVPGESNAGKKAPTFREIFNSQEIRAELEDHAKAAGRPYFGWRDIMEVYRQCKNVPFHSHINQDNVSQETSTADVEPPAVPSQPMIAQAPITANDATATAVATQPVPLVPAAIQESHAGRTAKKEDAKPKPKSKVAATSAAVEKPVMKAKQAKVLVESAPQRPPAEAVEGCVSMEPSRGRRGSFKAEVQEGEVKWYRHPHVSNGHLAVLVKKRNRDGSFSCEISSQTDITPPPSITRAPAPKKLKGVCFTVAGKDLK